MSVDCYCIFFLSGIVTGCKVLLVELLIKKISLWYIHLNWLRCLIKTKISTCKVCTNLKRSRNQAASGLKSGILTARWYKIKLQKNTWPWWVLNLNPRWYWSFDTLFWLVSISCFDCCQLSILWIPNVKEGRYKPRVNVSVILLVGVWQPSCAMSSLSSSSPCVLAHQ